MGDTTYADRLRDTITRRIKLRSVFTSPLLIEDNESRIRGAQDALATLLDPSLNAVLSASGKVRLS